MPPQQGNQMPQSSPSEPPFMPPGQNSQMPQSPPPEQSPMPPGQGNYTQQEEGNTIAVVGLILAFLVPLAGLICSIIGLNKSKLVAGKNHGLALAGIIISVFNMIVFLGLVISIVLIATPALQRLSRDTDRQADLSTIRISIEQYRSSNTGNLPQNKADLERSLSSAGSLVFFESIEDGVGDSIYTIYIAERTDTLPSPTDKIAGLDTVHIFIGARCSGTGVIGLTGNYINNPNGKVIEEGLTGDYAIVTTLEEDNEVICEDDR